MMSPRNVRLSGAHWVGWIDRNAPTSADIKDLDPTFRNKVTAFKTVLEDAGAKVKVEHTYRSDQAAYLWHWAWQIANRKRAPKAATPYSFPGRPVPDIEWDHGNLLASINRAADMVRGFKLTKSSDFAPSLNTRHRDGLAIDMIITWTGTISVKKKGGPEVRIIYGPVNANRVLHEIGASYGVKKLLRDAPHWSDDGS